MKYKELKKKVKELEQERFALIIKLGIANNTVAKQIDHIAALNKFIDSDETIHRITETNLEKQWVIVDYLQERNDKLVVELHNV